jgi:hypothetical protein
MVALERSTRVAVVHVSSTFNRVNEYEVILSGGSQVTGATLYIYDEGAYVIANGATPISSMETHRQNRDVRFMPGATGGQILAEFKRLHDLR